MELLLNKKSIEALHYLQTEIFHVVDHDDENECENFQKLARALFDSALTSNFVLFILAFSLSESRQLLYESILTFFPESMKQPSMDLVNMIE